MTSAIFHAVSSFFTLDHPSATGSSPGVFVQVNECNLPNFLSQLANSGRLFISTLLSLRIVLISVHHLLPPELVLDSLFLCLTILGLGSFLGIVGNLFAVCINGSHTGCYVSLVASRTSGTLCNSSAPLPAKVCLFPWFSLTPGYFPLQWPLNIYPESTSFLFPIKGVSLQHGLILYYMKDQMPAPHHRSPYLMCFGGAYLDFLGLGVSSSGGLSFSFVSCPGFSKQVQSQFGPGQVDLSRTCLAFSGVSFWCPNPTKPLWSESASFLTFWRLLLLPLLSTILWVRAVPEVRFVQPSCLRCMP